ncbi:hypothetical protein ANO14919_026210 [Xylariales sp. No.14919]|nr:hypothetical protein ANO14919_026210 [Xylariales sp. No.14919]
MWTSRFSIAVRSSIRAAGPFRRTCAPNWPSRRFLSEVATPASQPPKPEVPAETIINDKTYQTDSWFNVPPTVRDRVPRRLHLQKDHPLYITRQIIESVFPPPTYTYHNDLDPVVTTHQNFDSLGFPKDHPGRAKTDTYYINSDTLLRTHTSAHQVETFGANLSDGYLISADVYRRDEIDRSHHPVFHQMEGARSWDRTKVPNGDVAAAVWSDLEKLPKHDVEVEDPNPAFHHERNPLQEGHHSAAEAEAIAAHLKRSLELMAVEIFTRAKAAAEAVEHKKFVNRPIRMRWVEAYFPFTSPSWELEVYYDGDWLECLGCGVVKQDIYANAGVPSRLGWAFGIGLDRIAMLLFNIPDIRLFWSQDKRFLKQFKGVSDNLDALQLFVPFSRYPGCYKDVSFWLPSPAVAADDGSTAAADAQDGLHENDLMDVIRGVAGDCVESVKLSDEFTHPKSGRKSRCYRVNYRHLERTLTNKWANELHDKVKAALVRDLGVEIR